MFVHAERRWPIKVVGGSLGGSEREGRRGRAMSDRRWMIEDAFGRRWRLSIAWMHEAGGLLRERARFAVRELVSSSFHDVRGAVDACPKLLEIHEELTGEALSFTDSYRYDLGSLRRASERVSETLEWAAACGRLRIERAPGLHAALALDDAPDTLRELEAPPPSLASTPEAPADWVAVVVRDERGEPLANVRCRITTPGRPPLDAATDGNGRVLLRGIETGSCAIQLPDIDAREWDAGAGAG
jgi:hypothetical protein